jgi:hypothetical protein
MKWHTIIPSRSLPWIRFSPAEDNVRAGAMPIFAAYGITRSSVANRCLGEQKLCRCEKESPMKFPAVCKGENCESNYG